jgi:O-6-methylguanine DNA methyltransferase
VISFRQKVFKIVKKIPRGEVRSYSWVAKKLGNKNLARAVGQALSKNTDPQKVPCHRVIRADGSAGGYRWGVRKKIEMLKKEGVNIK